MISKLKNIWNTEDKKRLISNFLSLSLLQGANYILPLIILPYLLRVVGVEYFGLLAFATATILYFNVLVDYGFNLTATREISIHREDKNKLIEIFSSVMSIKFILIIFSFILLIIIIFSFKNFAKDWEIYFLSFGIVIGQALFPIWLFQGMEKMKYITYLNIFSKSLFTVAIFIFIENKNDFYLVPLLNSIGFILAGILSLWVINKEFNIVFRFQKLEILIYYFKDGVHVFLSQINISLFNNTNIVILGLMGSNTMVGYYSLAEKIVKALSSMQVPITNTIFPYISRSIKKNKQVTIYQLRKVIKFGVLGYVLILTPIFIFAHNIIYVLYGGYIPQSEFVLKIIICTPLFIFLNNIFGTQIMLNLDKKKEFLIILFKGAVLNIVLSLILSYYLMHIGIAIAIAIVELYIMLAMFFKVKDEVMLWQR